MLFSIWDYQKQVVTQVEIGDEFVDFSGKGGYTGYLAQYKKETRSLYDKGYKIGIEIRDINMAAPKYYTMRIIKDIRNSFGVKIGYSTVSYNEWGISTMTAESVSTTIFKRNKDGLLIGEATLSSPSIGSLEMLYVNITYKRDKHLRVNGMKKVTSFLDGTVTTVGYSGPWPWIIPITAPTMVYSIEEIDYKRDSDTYMRIGDVTDKRSFVRTGSNIWNLEIGGHTVTVNILTNVEQKGVADSPSVTFVKTYRNVVFSDQSNSAGAAGSDVLNGVFTGTLDKFNTANGRAENYSANWIATESRE
ncbi:MAG: hypothetical protein COW92_00485, partial [Candidatus Omnitrophica bacterium CG22_combo_CG10-13_8_21_14_all_43_16]